MDGATRGGGGSLPALMIRGMEAAAEDSSVQVLPCFGIGGRGLSLEKRRHFYSYGFLSE